MNEPTETVRGSSETPAEGGPRAGDGYPPGHRLGHLRIEALLGRGAMGEVYVAFDERLERRVALKAIAPQRRLDPESRARLLREAQLLSRLDHPNICRIHDFVESDAADYLVLELVEGVTLRSALRDGLAGRPLDAAQRLEIAEQIAAALRAAHASGVIHRDLKPGNVMLAVPDGAAVKPRSRKAAIRVKVLDFGIARRLAVAGEVPRRTSSLPAGGIDPEGARTELGRILGTPRFMSPEQARGEPPTPAGDLYSLGLLLRELFTGRAGYPRDLSLPKLIARVRKAETLPISGIDRHLGRLIGELESPIPAERPSAEVVSQRLRWIAGRPRRRRRWAAAAMLAALVAGGAVKYAFDLRRERNEAIAARRQAEAARAEAEAVVEHLTGMFELTEPGSGRGASITVREILDQGARRVEDGLRDQPHTQARLFETIGSLYLQLGLYDPARQALERSVELYRGLDAGAELARGLGSLALLYRLAGDYRAAEPLFERSLDLQTDLLGASHPDVATTLNNFALFYRDTGDYARAEDLLRRALGGADDPRSPITLSNLASVLLLQGDTAESEKLLREAQEVFERSPAVNDLTLAANLSSLATLYRQRGELEPAEPLFRRALELYEGSLGDRHPWVARTLNSLADLYRARGELERAEPLFERSLRIKEEVLGPRHPSVAASLHNLALLHAERDDLETAEGLLARAAEIWRETVGGDHPNLARTLHHQARLRLRRQRAGDAEELLRRALAIEVQALGREHPHTRETVAALAESICRQGREPEPDLGACPPADGSG